MTIKAVVFDAYGTLYDIQSVAAVTEREFAGRGELITQLWRIKQLEYTWLRSLMGTYEDFEVVTRDSLAYTLDCLGLEGSGGAFERIFDKYLHLDLYPEASAALASLRGTKLAILSNGSPSMLGALTQNTGLDRVLDDVISVDDARVFKPSSRAYALAETRLGVAPRDALFVSSNPWDVAGAKAFGFNVAWIERVPREAMARELRHGGALPPQTLFKALRTQMDVLGFEPDHRIASLAALVDIVARG
ncbi:haloacid dehalogenase type II [Rhodopseudomonas palustris]|uniref:(S)-2-haloacid dehalogenase n=1 Tax=Rhodopseudomonas palustris TaxID=1076 RepID=A0A418V3S5_RHOPL|nr:haloacid dehalogenase type II [Rhodopseudomonas palustris]RJF70700.1 haloacid dehalogenase type II [Rhodopseudomonas palustris]